MTDPAHLDDLISATAKPLSRKLVETYRQATRDPSVTKAEHVQRLKDQMEVAVQEERSDAASQSNHP